MKMRATTQGRRSGDAGGEAGRARGGKRKRDWHASGETACAAAAIHSTVALVRGDVRGARQGRTCLRRALLPRHEAATRTPWRCDAQLALRLRRAAPHRCCTSQARRAGTRMQRRCHAFAAVVLATLLQCAESRRALRGDAAAAPAAYALVPLSTPPAPPPSLQQRCVRTVCRRSAARCTSDAHFPASRAASTCGSQLTAKLGCASFAQRPRARCCPQHQLHGHSLQAPATGRRPSIG